ncbi:PREDICTED: uncharacterized protein LOC109188687 [Ipomoea nil]|uniref:uncharacterized protein LOC109188687 n=1 Tax=Ipomoea nil TaxID=35883 RepID=UPI000900F955|nr:PREDICTED: uncharacterized protein LOC109188687 [Ipomoea nil]
MKRRLAVLKENRSLLAVEEFLTVERELEVLLRQEEVFWLQRSKQLWLKHGDVKTKFFHRAATALRKRNLLLRVKDQEGAWVEGAAMNAEILRLKGALGHVVSQSQSAFVPKQLLTDNIIVVGEVGHFLRRKTCWAMGWVALKLDMAKAYDRMEWGVNGETVGAVCPTRGIRQGDPLSPNLFILCAEALSILLQQKEESGTGANLQEALRIKDCLDLYCAASGQLKNFDNSSAVFSTNTNANMRERVSDCFGVREAKDLGQYLGLPSILGRNKIATFRYIEEKIRERIGSWQHKLLSKAGKEILLKSIAQSLPIFTMSIVLLPIRICDTLEKLSTAIGGEVAGQVVGGYID